MIKFYKIKTTVGFRYQELHKKVSIRFFVFFALNALPVEENKYIPIYDGMI